MGIVFKARQIKPERLVALKVISVGELALPKLVERFRTEAEAGASLEHPNIVPIYEVGEHQGHNFFSMRLIEGQTLGRALSGRPMSLRLAAELLATIARAVHYAHQRGVLHRDLKPNNILLDAAGAPHLTDFGLAKLLEKNSDLTLSGAVLGTPSYMSPEQAAGQTRQMTIASDVYGLGAVLYEMLTGRPPFTGGSPVDIVRQVTEREPPRPSTLNREVPRDLDIICLKCLEKEPARRFGSAERLAEDLERWLRHEPIRSQPSTAWEYGVKWVRRHRARAALYATVVVSFLAFTIGSVIFNIRLTAARKAEERHRLDAEQSAEQSRQRLVRLNVAAGNRFVEEMDYFRGLLWFTEAMRLENGDAAREEIHRYRIEEAFRHSPRLAQILFHGRDVHSLEFSPDGARILTGCGDRHARIWDVASGIQLTPPMPHGGIVGAVAFSPDGRRVATFGNEGVAHIWDAATGQPLSPPLKQRNFRAASTRFSPAIAFSGDGARLLSVYGSTAAHLWNGTNGDLIRVFTHTNVVCDAALSPDGRRIATTCEDKQARIWDVETGALLQVLPHDQTVAWTAFSPDGKRVLTVADRRIVQVWDLASGKKLGQPIAHDGKGNVLFQVTFSPDGRRVLTAGWDNTARIWDAETGQILTRLNHHGGVVSAVFSPDGRSVATACWDGAARVWETESGLVRTSVLPQGAPLLRVVFSPSGRELAAASINGTVRVWSLPTNDTIVQQLPHNEAVWVEFSRDQRFLVTSATGGERGFRVWDAHTGRPVTALLAPGERVNQAIFSPDGSRVATASQDGPVRLFDVQTGGEVFAALPHAQPVRWIAFNPDGTRLVTACGDGAAYVWDAATGRVATAPLRHRGAVSHAEFNRDGTSIVTASEDSTARVWNAATSEPATSLLEHDGAVRRAVFSPDGRQVATTCSARGRAGDYAQVWDTTTGRPVMPLLRHDAGVTDVVFSQDGRRLATGCADGSARIWDTGTGQALTPPLRLPAIVKQVGFSPDGRRLAGASEDGTVVIWDAVTGELASPRMTHPIRYDIARFHFSGDGRRLAIATAAEAVWVRRLVKTESLIEDLIEEAQVLSAHRIDPVSGMAPLDSLAQSNVWQRHRAKRP